MALADTSSLRIMELQLAGSRCEQMMVLSLDFLSRTLNGNLTRLNGYSLGRDSVLNGALIAASGKTKNHTNDSVTREAVTKDQMRKFLAFVKEDKHYCKYHDAMYILFHTGLRISEFVGLTISDLDMKNKTIRVDHQLQRRSDGTKYIESTKTNAGTRELPMENDVYACFKRILASRKPPQVEPMIDGRSGFLFFDKNEEPMVAMHWEKYFQHIVQKYNKIYKEELPKITPHVCRHTYCTNKAKSGMNPKTLQYLMGHSEISVTMDTYTHLGLEDAWNELQRLQLQFSQKELGLETVETA